MLIRGDNRSIVHLFDQGSIRLFGVSKGKYLIIMLPCGSGLICCAAADGLERIVGFF